MPSIGNSEHGIEPHSDLSEPILPYYLTYARPSSASAIHFAQRKLGVQQQHTPTFQGQIWLFLIVEPSMQEEMGYRRISCNLGFGGTIARLDRTLIAGPLLLTNYYQHQPNAGRNLLHCLGLSWWGKYPGGDTKCDHFPLC
jgi:hypothetical protein